MDTGKCENDFLISAENWFIWVRMTQVSEGIDSNQLILWTIRFSSSPNDGCKHASHISLHSREWPRPIFVND